MEIIRYDHVSFAYPGCDQKALDDICLTFEESGFYLICGPSGGGKSTFLRQMKKNLIPYGTLDGSVSYRGEEIHQMDAVRSAAEIGFVMQNPGEGIVTDKVWHELAFGLENLGVSRGEMKRRVAEMASFFGMEGWFDKNVNELSGGQQQILNLASVMVMQPQVLILDEPTSQLDPLAAEDFLQILRRINRELGTTVVISEHRLEKIFSEADRICVLENGRIQSFDTPQNTAWMYLEQAAREGGSLFEGLPASLRIACQRQQQKKGLLPLTVREGRLWMKGLLGEEKVPQNAQTKKNLALQEAPPVAGMKRRFLPHRHVVNESFGDRNGKEASSVIGCSELEFRYEKEGRKVLRNVSFNVYEGEWFCVFGTNGAGKSTLLQILCQTLRQQEGTVEIFGKKVRGLKDAPLGYEKMALLPQDPKALFTEITVREELEEALSDVPASEEEKKRQAADMLCQMGLERYEDRHPYDLSGGEQQRLALGKLLLLKPVILLLDEPTKGLDPENKAKLGELLEGLRRKKLTILTVSHDVEFCGKYATRCGLLFYGEMIGIAETHDFFRGNHFYTTAANQIAKEWFPDAITCEEVLDAWRL